MERDTGLWDIRCPGALLRMFPSRQGAWYLVGRERALDICWALSRAYRVSYPRLSPRAPRGKFPGAYSAPTRTIYLRAQVHIREVLHEWYHHLERASAGRYQSSDNPRGLPRHRWSPGQSLAEQFAERLWVLMNTRFTAPADRTSITGAVNYLTRHWRTRYHRLSSGRQMRLITFYQSIIPHVIREEQDMATRKQSPRKSQKPAASQEMKTAVKLAFARLEKEHRAEARALVQQHTPAPPPTPKKDIKAGMKPSKLSDVSAGIRGTAPPRKPRAGAGDSQVITVLPALKTFLEKEVRKGTKAHTTRSLYRTGMTVSEFKEACAGRGGDAGYLPHDIKNSRIRVA